MSKITQILDASFRSGTGKTGKPWVMMQIQTDDGKQASIFAPAAVGDEVSVTYNEQYKNYSAEKMTPIKIEQNEVKDTLKTILSSLGRIEQHLKINPVKTPDVVPTDVPDQVDMDSIPF